MRENMDARLNGALRGAAEFVFFITVSSITSFTVKGLTALGHSLLAELPNFIIYILCAISSLLIFNSTLLAFSTADKVSIEKFIEDGKDVSFAGSIKRTLGDARSISEVITLHLLIAISACLGAFPEIGGIFFDSGYRSGIFPTAVLTPICFAITLLAKYEAARHHQKLYRENNLEKVESPLWFAARLITVAILYPLAMPLSPLLGYAIFSLGAVVVRITVVLSILGAIAGFIALILLLYGIVVLRGIAKRRKFFKKLRRIANDGGYSLCDIKDPYRSFITSSSHCTFTLEYENRTYSCLMISTLRKTVPLVFTSPTDAYYLHRIGTKDHGISLSHKIDFYHPEGDEKIIIVNPTPKRVLVAEGRSERRVFCSDKIWGITVHDADSFLGAADRHCLTRKNDR